MKFRQFLFLLVIPLVVSCSSRSEILLQVSNPLDQSREDATILLSRGEISNWMEIPGGTVPLLMDENRDPLPSQTDDVNGDGQWDELFALIDLPAKGQKKVVLQFIPPGDYPEFESRTNLRLGDASKPGYPELETASRLEGVSYQNYSGRTEAAYQMEGPAWENDRVGFRNYMDQRNGMDIFGKLTQEMVLDSVGVKGKPSYHESAEWGMDVLKVGTSLGAGAIGYQYNDTIYRVGDNGSGSYQVVFEGTQRSRFNLSFANWKVEDSALDVIHQIEIAGGRRYYQGTVTYSGSELALDLVTGIVNMKSEELHVMELGAHHTALVTHDLQSEDTTLLAMAIMIPRDYLLEYGETEESGDGIIQTYYAILDAGAGEPVPYRFYALWEKEDPRWASFDNVTGYLKNEAARWTQSVIIEVIQ